tara:strand:+ start:6419 stop:6751 length:333 start_codon:yes stop_codon:yes gene_type:complete
MAKITFQPNNITHEVSDGSSLIEVCELLNDISLPFGCTEGTCGICELTILSGGKSCSPPTDNEIDYLYQEDINAGMRLGCQMKIISGELTLTWKSNQTNKDEKPFPKTNY